jgi:hypothetical protein
MVQKTTTCHAACDAIEKLLLDGVTAAVYRGCFVWGRHRLFREDYNLVVREQFTAICGMPCIFASCTKGVDVPSWQCGVVWLGDENTDAYLAAPRLLNGVVVLTTGNPEAVTSALRNAAVALGWARPTTPFENVAKVIALKACDKARHPEAVDPGLPGDRPVWKGTSQLLSILREELRQHIEAEATQQQASNDTFERYKAATLVAVGEEAIEKIVAIATQEHLPATQRLAQLLDEGLIDLNARARHLATLLGCSESNLKQTPTWHNFMVRRQREQEARRGRHKRNGHITREELTAFTARPPRRTDRD